MENSEIPQQFKLRMLESVDKALFKKSLLYFIVLRKLWAQVATSFIKFRNINEKLDGEVTNNVLLEAIAEKLQEICEAGLSKASAEDKFSISIPIPGTPYSNRIRSLSSNLDLKISNVLGANFLCLEYAKASGYEIKIKTAAATENALDSKLEDFSLVGEHYYLRDEPEHEQKIFWEKEALAFLWLCWTSAETLHDPFMEKINLEANKPLFSDISKILGRTEEYIKATRENLKIKKPELTFENFLEKFAALDGFLDKMLNFYLKYSAEYEQSFLAQSEPRSEKPLEFKHLNKKVAEESEALIAYIVSLGSALRNNTETKNGFFYPFFKTDLDIFLNEAISEFSKVKIDPFAIQYLVGDPSRWRNHTTYFFLEFVKDKEYEEKAVIKIAAGKGGKIQKENLEKKLNKSKIKKEGETLDTLGRYFTKDFLFDILELKKGTLAAERSFVQRQIANNYFLSNVFLDGNLISEDNIEGTSFEDHPYDKKENPGPSLIWTDIVWVSGCEPYCEQFLLKGEHTIFFSYGKYGKIVKKVKKNFYSEEEDKPKEEIEAKNKYSEAEFLFYLTMNFLYKASNALETEENFPNSSLLHWGRKEALIIEMEEEIKALLEVYNFVEALNNMALPFILMNKL